MTNEYKADPLAPHINSDGKAFNGNYTVVGLSFLLVAVGVVIAIGTWIFG